MRSMSCMSERPITGAAFTHADAPESRAQMSLGAVVLALRVRTPLHLGLEIGIVVLAAAFRCRGEVGRGVRRAQGQREAQAGVAGGGGGGGGRVGLPAGDGPPLPLPPPPPLPSPPPHLAHPSLALQWITKDFFFQHTSKDYLDTGEVIVVVHTPSRRIDALASVADFQTPWTAGQFHHMVHSRRDWVTPQTPHLTPHIPTYRSTRARRTACSSSAAAPRSKRCPK